MAASYCIVPSFSNAYFSNEHWSLGGCIWAQEKKENENHISQILTTILMKSGIQSVSIHPFMKVECHLTITFPMSQMTKSIKKKNLDESLEPIYIINHQPKTRSTFNCILCEILS